MFLNPRPPRAGVSRPGGAGRSQGRRRSAASGPPHRLGIPVTGQVIDLQPDQGPFDDRQVPLLVQPGGAAVRRGWTPFPAAAAIPFREVIVLVVTGGSGQVAGSDRASSRLCLRGRPFRAGTEPAVISPSSERTDMRGWRKSSTRQHRPRHGPCCHHPAGAVDNTWAPARSDGRADAQVPACAQQHVRQQRAREQLHRQVPWWLRGCEHHVQHTGEQQRADREHWSAARDQVTGHRGDPQPPATAPPAPGASGSGRGLGGGWPWSRRRTAPAPDQGVSPNKSASRETPG